MPFLTLLPELVRRRGNRVELSISRATRVLYLVLGIALILVLLRDPAGTPFAVMFAIVIALAASMEDRWIFDGDAKEIRKRYGVTMFAKSWAIDLDLLTSIKLETVFSGADRDDPHAKVTVGSGKNQCAIRLMLSDGRTMVLYSTGRKKLPLLQMQATAISEATGRPLVVD
jgi:hypothetical protein